MSIRDSKANLKREVVLEAGNPIRIEDFFYKDPDDAEFITDISSIDTSIPAIYNLKLHYDVLFNETVSLKIEDTTAPTADGLTKKMFSYEKVPEASEMVDNVYDLSGISSIEYEYDVDVSAGGDVIAPVRITDSYGNSALIFTKFEVTVDSKGPKIYGVKDITIVQGETPDLSGGIIAIDNYSKNMPVRIDASKLDIDKPGTYEVVYKVQDDAGNVTTEIATVTVKKKETPKKVSKKSKTKKTTKKYKRKTPSYYSKVDKMAASLVKKLKRGSDVETARAIFNWVHKNVHYVHSSSRYSGKRAAYEGLTKHRGNCRVFAYTCQILLNKAGIKNMIVTRYPVTSTEHFWNLVYINGGWYHCDATPFRSHPSLYFKLTDKQLDKYHRFKKSKYPARATS